MLWLSEIHQFDVRFIFAVVVVHGDRSVVVDGSDSTGIRAVVISPKHSHGVARAPGHCGYVYTRKVERVADARKRKCVWNVQSIGNV